jgi:hypothetical protein
MKKSFNNPRSKPVENNFNKTLIYNQTLVKGKNSGVKANLNLIKPLNKKSMIGKVFI